MSQDPIQPDPSGRIPPGAQVVVDRKGRRVTGTVVDNQGPAYLVRFGDGEEAWCDRTSLERDNPGHDGSPDHSPQA